MGVVAAFRDTLRDAGGRPFLAAIAGLFAIGIALRAIHLFDVIRLDEATTYLLFASRPFDEAVTSYQLPNNHLLNTVLVKLSVTAFGPEPWSLRHAAGAESGVAAAVLHSSIGDWVGEDSHSVAEGARATPSNPRCPILPCSVAHVNSLLRKSCRAAGLDAFAGRRYRGTLPGRSRSVATGQEGR